MRLKNTRRALHAALDDLLDALEADLASTDEAPAQAPQRKARRAARAVPPIPADFTPTAAELEAVGRRL